MRTTGAVIAAVMLLSAGCFSQAKPSVTQVAELCGELQHVWYTPVTGTQNMLNEHREALRNVVLKLFARAGEAACCTGDLLRTAKSGRRGTFDFKKLAPGNYWLVASWNGREYSMPVEIDPKTPNASPCVNQLFGIHQDGAFRFGWVVQVD